jgi:hypothetical protein
MIASPNGAQHDQEITFHVMDFHFFHRCVLTGFYNRVPGLGAARRHVGYVSVTRLGDQAVCPHSLLAAAALNVVLVQGQAGADGFNFF